MPCRAVHVGADHVVHARALGMVFAVVATAILIDRAERLYAVAQECLAGVVFVTNHIAELIRVLNQIANHAHVLAYGVGTDDADAVQSGTVHGFEVFAEQLVQAANHKHRGTVCGQRAQQVGTHVEVINNLLLTGVLTTTAQNEIDMFRPVITLIVLVNNRLITVQAQSTADSQHIARVTVDVHVLRVQGHDVDYLAHVAFSLSISPPVGSGEFPIRAISTLPLAGGGAKRRRVVTCLRLRLALR